MKLGWIYDQWHTSHSFDSVKGLYKIIAVSNLFGKIKLMKISEFFDNFVQLNYDVFFANVTQIIGPDSGSSKNIRDAHEKSGPAWSCAFTPSVGGWVWWVWREGCRHILPEGIGKFHSMTIHIEILDAWPILPVLSVTIVACVKTIWVLL